MRAGLSVDKHCLTKQIDSLRVENQQLKAALRQAELRLSTIERERTCQQVSLSEKICTVHELTAAKQQLIRLKEERDALNELLSSKSGDLEQQNFQLKTQLQAAQAELAHTKSSLSTLEGADGHGLKVALRMQRRITAKREQIDFLQVQIQQLEESVEKLKLDKHQQALEVQRQTQELMSESEIRRTLEAEVKASYSQERELKSRAERLEAALYKMSDSFAECQDFIQEQEQEIMRLKLQHALDLKELQSQNRRNVSRSPAGLHQCHVNGLMEARIPSRFHPHTELTGCAGMDFPLESLQLRVHDPIVEPKSFARQQGGGADEEHGPHADNGLGKSEEERKSNP
ncbi:coiled-coil domain-containing protein 158-like isoform X2 [Triplophysa rosa]|nr:coiled-coil domain-containing protein 158-like isoform X2 [Triplophysa rosa]